MRRSTLRSSTWRKCPGRTATFTGGSPRNSVFVPQLQASYIRGDNHVRPDATTCRADEGTTEGRPEGVQEALEAHSPGRGIATEQKPALDRPGPRHYRYCPAGRLSAG